jgi:hypothetical protein
MTNTDPTKNEKYVNPCAREWCRVRLLSMIEERKNLRNRENIHCRLWNKYFVTVKEINICIYNGQPDRDDDSNIFVEITST